MISELRQYSSGNREKLEHYVRHSLNRNKSPAEVKSALMNVGWSPRIINSVLNKEICGRGKSREFHRYFGIALIMILTLSLAGLMAFSNPNLTGAFILNGQEWENSLEITANNSIPEITAHILFGQYKPVNCADGIYIETSNEQIQFGTENEIYIDGKCSETDVVFDNIIYKSIKENTTIPETPITAFAVSEGTEIITYTIYYGKTISIPISNETVPENITIPEENIIIPSVPAIVFDQQTYAYPPGAEFDAVVKVKNPANKSVTLTLAPGFDARLKLKEVIGKETNEMNALADKKNIDYNFDIKSMQEYNLLDEKLKLPVKAEISASGGKGLEFITPAWTETFAANEEKEFSIRLKMPDSAESGELWFYALGDGIAMAVDPWWNSSWAYRQNITITENSGFALTDFQINLTINTASLVSAGKMQSDCDDIRFVNSTNSSIDYWIETSTCNSAATNIWVEVPNIPASGTETIAMYYGNPSAAAGKSGDNTFLFFDDFEDPSDAINTTKWSSTTTGGAPVVTVSGGTLYQYSYDAGHRIGSETFFTENITLEERFKVEVVDGTTNDRNRMTMIGAPIDYGIFATGVNDLQVFWNNWELQYPPQNSWLRVKETVNHIGLYYSLTGTGFSYTNSIAYTPPASFGYNQTIGDGVGAGAYGNVTTDWIFVRKWAATEPTASFASEELPGQLAAQIAVWDETNASMPYGGQIRYADEQTYFFANYTNSSGLINDASCSINFTTISNSYAGMFLNTTKNLFEYNRTFSSANTYPWNVTCNRTGYDTLNATGTVTISSQDGSPPEDYFSLNQIPNYAINHTNHDVLARVNSSNDIRGAADVPAGEGGYFILNFTGPPANSIIENITAFFEHNESTTTNFNVSIRVYNSSSGLWQLACDIQERINEYTDSCNITKYVTSPYTSNYISLEYNISNDGGALQTAYLDYAYLYINYTLGIANLTIWDETDAGMPYGSQTRYANQSTYFFANYTNSTGLINDANCNINFTAISGSNASMFLNTTKNLFEYNRTFASANTYQWNVTCNRTGYDTLNATDTVTISSQEELPPESGINLILTYWPMFRHDSQNTGFANITGPETENLDWIHSFSEPHYGASPVTYNDVLYAAVNTTVYMFNITNGTLIQSYDLTKTNKAYATAFLPIQSTPAVANGRVYVAAAALNVEICGSMLFALNATNITSVISCNDLWPSIGCYLRSSPNVFGDVVYISTEEVNGQFFAMNGTTNDMCVGEMGTGIIWAKSTMHGYASPAVADNVSYFASDDGKVYGYNATDGTYITNTSTDWGKIRSSPAVVDGVLYFGSYNTTYNGVYAYTNLTKSPADKLWNYTTGGAVESSPAVANGIVYIGSNDSKVYAFNATNGSVVWSYTADSGVSSSPAVSGNGTLYVGTNNNTLYALNATNGNLLWSHDYGGANYGDYRLSSPALAAPNGSVGRLAYIANNTLKVFVWSPSSTAIDKCMDITVPNQEYILTQDLVGNMSDGICLHASASNITVDCQNYNINGTYKTDPGSGSATYGIYFGNLVKNVTVKNCFAHNYSYGVYFSYAEDSLLSSTHTYGNYFGIETQTTNYSILDNNTVYNNIYDGIYIYGTGGEEFTIGHNNITNNRIYNNSQYGIYYSGDNGGLTLNNTLYFNEEYDLFSSESLVLYWINNTFGAANPTTASLVFPTGINIYVRGVENPPADVPDYLNISKYLNISAYANVVLNISYSESELGIYNENSLIEQAYAASWKLISSAINTAEDYISVNVFPGAPKIFAPFINKNDYYSVYECMDITIPGTYVLKNNIADSPLRICININATDVTFDGSNYTIDGVDLGKSTGISLNSTTNVSVFNVTLSDWLTDVYVYHSYNSTITNTSSNSSTYGIYALYSSGINITSNNPKHFSNYGIYFEYANNSRIMFNNASGAQAEGGYGAKIAYCNNILVESNYFNDGGAGIDCSYNYANITIVSNEFNGNYYYGIEVTDSPFTNVTANTADNTWGYDGIYLDGCDNSTFDSNIATNSTEYDLYLRPSPGAVFRNQTITGPVVIDFVWDGEIGINGTMNKPADPANYYNISKYLQIDDLVGGSSLALNISYTDADLGDVSESTLAIARNDGSWETTTSNFANNYGVKTAQNYVYANITDFSTGSVFAPLGTTGLAECNFTVLIDGVETDAFASAGRPYNVTIYANEIAGAGLNNATIKTIEYNGYSLFVMPQFQQTNVSEKVWGESWTDANGRVSYTVVPTGARYVSESDIGNYNITIEIYRNGESDECANRTYSVTDAEFPDATSTTTVPNQPNIDSYKTEVLRVYDRTKSWFELGGGEVINITIYTNGTTYGMFSVVAGKPYGINVTVRDAGEEPVPNAVVQFTEKNGYPPFVLPQSGISNSTNYNRGRTLTDSGGNAKLTIIPTGGRYVSEAVLGNYTIELSVYNSTATFNTTTIPITNKEFPDASGSAQTVYNQNNLDSFKTEILRIYDRIKSWLGG